MGFWYATILYILGGTSGSFTTLDFKNPIMFKESQECISYLNHKVTEFDLFVQRENLSESFMTGVCLKRDFNLYQNP